LSLSLVAGILGRPFGITTRERLLGAALQHATVNIFFAGVLLLFLLAGTSSKKHYVHNSVLRFFGYISYGLYLNHILAFRMYDRVCLRYWPWLVPSNNHFELVVLKFALAGGCAVGTAYLSRKYFEEPFLRIKDRIARNADSEIRVWTTPSLSSLQNLVVEKN
jgi:peptidoglycan/LPS O-acetylase OafA/YrhL